MKRDEFLKTIVLGTGITFLGQVGCSTNEPQSRSQNAKRKKGEVNTDYRDRDWAELFPPVFIIEIDMNSINVLDTDRAEVNGYPLRHFKEANWVDGWTTADGLSISWTINVPRAFDCSIALTYSCAQGSAGSDFEVAQETHGYVGYDYNGRKTVNKITGKTEVTSSWLSSWRNFERKEINGLLHIPKGHSVITLRATSKPKNAEAVMYFHSLEIIPEPAKASIIESKKRAAKLRSKTDWFVNAKYGVMFHYSSTVYPRSGPRKPFDQAVREFNVDKFVEMVKKTGAGYVFFFVSHGIFWFPAPIKTVEEILPGRTCDRDLIAELASALEPHNIKLLLYYNPSYNDDVDWRKAAGWGSQLHFQTSKECGNELVWDKSPFYENQCRILEEIGERYGRSVWGYWFDNGYPFQLFERQAHACKVGNPDRIIGYNSGIYPKITDFQDFFAAEFGCSPILPPDNYFNENGPQGGLQPHGTIFIDGAWHHFRPDTEIGPQRFSTEALIDYAKKCIDRKLVLTINMCIYQDGTVSPVTLEQMKSLRKAIRGV
jgi:hypothetical protein